MDDVYSLVCVAYFFAFGSLPWIDAVEKAQEQFQNNGDSYDRTAYIKLRWAQRHFFNMQLILKSGELKPLFVYLSTVRKREKHIELNLKKDGQIQAEDLPVPLIDYEHMITLLPNVPPLPTKYLRGLMTEEQK